MPKLKTSQPDYLQDKQPSRQQIGILRVIMTIVIQEFKLNLLAKTD